jgi:hypothetical protein
MSDGTTVDPAIRWACDGLHAIGVATVEVRQVGAGVRAARREVEAVPLPLAAMCDWGDCVAQADYIRWSGTLGWLPVCGEHRAGVERRNQASS